MLSKLAFNPTVYCLTHKRHCQTYFPLAGATCFKWCTFCLSQEERHRALFVHLKMSNLLLPWPFCTGCLALGHLWEDWNSTEECSASFLDTRCLRYEVTSTKFTRDLFKELVISLVAAVFLGFGILFLLLWVGVYV